VAAFIVSQRKNAQQDHTKVKLQIRKSNSRNYMVSFAHREKKMENLMYRRVFG